MRLIHETGHKFFIRGKILYFIDYRYKIDQYYQFTFNDGVENITRDVFLKSKYGKNYDKILPKLEGESEVTDIDEDGNIVSCGFLGYYFQWFGPDGECIKRKEDIGFDSIYGFALEEDKIWYVIPTRDYVGCYSLTLNQEVHLLDEICDSGYFSLPESIRCYNGILYISDMGNKRLITIDTKTLIPKEYKKFEIGVSDYIQYDNQEFVLLEHTGIFCL